MTYIDILSRIFIRSRFIQTRHFGRHFSSIIDKSGKDDKVIVHKRMPKDTDFKSASDILFYEFHRDPDDMIPRQTDIIIIGGGIIGWSAAYFLRSLVKMDVTVVERDPTFSQSATVLSMGGISQQFSESEKIKMSLFGAEFLRNVRKHLCILDEDPPNIMFEPQGHLLLASEKGAEQLLKNINLQKELGAKLDTLKKSQILDRWPWISVDDVELAAYGYENEGAFDPWALMLAFRRKATSLGVCYVQGEVVEFEHKLIRFYAAGDYDQVSTKNTCNYVVVRGADENLYPIRFSQCINAAGPWAGDVAELFGVGKDETGGVLPLPVEPRAQQLFVVKPTWRAGTSSSFAPGIDTPWLVDFQGLQLKREGLRGDFVTWTDPAPSLVNPPRIDGEHEHSKNAVYVPEKLEADHNWFYELIWPQLAHRIPCMESAEIRSAWACYYDYNFVDQNLIIGRHPGYKNLIFCNGSSGCGTQHSIAIGRALTELIIYGQYQTIDLERFNFDRFYEKLYIKDKVVQ